MYIWFPVRHFTYSKHWFLSDFHSMFYVHNSMTHHLLLWNLKSSEIMFLNSFLTHHSFWGDSLKVSRSPQFPSSPVRAPQRGKIQKHTKLSTLNSNLRSSCVFLSPSDLWCCWSFLPDAFLVHPISTTLSFQGLVPIFGSSHCLYLLSRCFWVFKKLLMLIVMTYAFDLRRQRPEDGGQMDLCEFESRSAWSI